MAKRTITTASGFKCSVYEDALDDVRVLKALIKMQKQDEIAQAESIFLILNKLLGDDGEENLYEFLEERDGKATPKAVSDELADIFTKLGKSKKKS